jgi:hypothetical protein
MSPPTVRMACPRCRTPLAAVLAPFPATQWFPCPHCGTPVPVVVPRDPPPLYSWEVLPGLYPALPRPKAPRWRSRPVVTTALVVVVIVSVVLLALLVAYGVAASSPASYGVNGFVVLPSGRAATGAAVVLTENNGHTLSTTIVDPSGSFSFTNVPSGGISINVTLSGYAPVTVDTFASPVYDAGTTGLGIQLEPGSADNGTTYALSPFPDLETFVASIGAEAVLLGLIAAVAAGAAAGYRKERIALGVVGGGAGASAPLTFYFLSLTSIFPTVALASAIAGAVGAFVVAVGALELARLGTPVRAG